MTFKQDTYLNVVKSFFPETYRSLLKDCHFYVHCRLKDGPFIVFSPFTDDNVTSELIIYRTG